MAQQQLVAPFLVAPAALLASIVAAAAAAPLKNATLERIAWLQNMTKQQPNWSKDAFTFTKSLESYQYEGLLYIHFDDSFRDVDNMDFSAEIPDYKSVLAAVKDADPTLITGTHAEYAQDTLKTIKRVFGAKTLKGPPKRKGGAAYHPKTDFAGVLLYKGQNNEYAVLAAFEAAVETLTSVYIAYVGNVTESNGKFNKALYEFQERRKKGAWPSACTILIYLNFVWLGHHGFNNVYLQNAATEFGCMCYFTAAEAAHYEGFMLKKADEDKEDFQVLNIATTKDPNFRGRRSGRKLSDFIQWDSSDPESCKEADRFFKNRVYFSYFVRPPKWRPP